EGIPAAADIVNLRYKSCPEMEGQDHTIIMEVLRDYGYVDFRGMGVRTKIIPLTQAMSGQPPEFTATDDYLKTILYRSPSS
ncbi:TPA: hypothetical protein ACP7SU_004426, partial [Escherichia coli]